ncbi:MAG TPA: hypothetical protein VNV88_11405 [Candidatus Solibacter sp.]|jgi:hypothetical protein|nr:hypothetical protein [Candidatus Solibacter sp.]
MLSSFARAVLISLLAAVSLHGQTMTVAQRLPLHKATHGVEGWLEVLTDARLSQNLKREMWGVGDWPFVLSQNDPRRKVFAKQPPLNATLRVLDRQSHVVDTKKLEMPLARISEEQIQGQHPTFMVTVDYSVGFGSYAGLSTFLLDITDGKLAWASAMDLASETTVPILLAKTLKSDWKVIPFGPNKDILRVYCQPGDGVDEFVVGYVRYRFDGQRWIRYERTQAGFWESDNPFPPTEAFPLPDGLRAQ